MSKSKSARASAYSSESTKAMGGSIRPTSIRQRLREFFLFEEARARSAALTPSQHTAIRSSCAAAQRRLRAARDAMGTSRIFAAFLLYREGAFLLTIAYLAARNPHLDASSLTRAVAFDNLHAFLEREGTAIPHQYDGVQRILVADGLDFERLSPRDSKRTVRDLDVATQWLSDLIEPRSPGALRLAMISRVAIGCTSLLVLLVSGVAWAVAPPNIALHKAVVSSSQSYDTKPEGAVNGQKKYDFEFCSAWEQEPWLAIDLGQAHAISRIKIYGRGDYAFDQSIPLALDVSDDGINYRKEFERNTPFSDYRPWTIKPSLLVTRFIRLRTERTSVLVLNEVEVFGRPAVPAK
jgi:hypothetical protein